ncbi:hypothetical protein GYMLUDRAFT_248660 [Collybiopsis luxurians FD-317 M1]|uniref:Uncharacterized protein n=1 Tax=Collybiopsis luxurians FD-317 M1 TaxID=944289 RepID=A0A0D0CBI9_9AGAR|nr:hypothetical protein GYMLUDRAFT_248660 [Collybiopsis luxurians FD-317 M1]
MSFIDAGRGNNADHADEKDTDDDDEPEIIDDGGKIDNVGDAVAVDVTDKDDSNNGRICVVVVFASLLLLVPPPPPLAPPPPFRPPFVSALIPLTLSTLTLTPLIACAIKKGFLTTFLVCSFTSLTLIQKAARVVGTKAGRTTLK